MYAGWRGVYAVWRWVVAWCGGGFRRIPLLPPSLALVLLVCSAASLFCLSLGAGCIPLCIGVPLALASFRSLYRSLYRYVF